MLTAFSSLIPSDACADARLAWFAEGMVPFGEESACPKEAKRHFYLWNQQGPETRFVPFTGIKMA